MPASKSASAGTRGLAGAGFPAVASIRGKFVGPYDTPPIALRRPIPIAPNGGVAAVDIRSIPEGPQPKGGAPIDLIEPYIPDPLPAPLFQWFCGTGGDPVVTLGKGRQVTYGPCYRPASIDRLWAESIYIDTKGQCAPRCGPGGEPGP